MKFVCTNCFDTGKLVKPNLTVAICSCRIMEDTIVYPKRTVDAFKQLWRDLVDRNLDANMA